MILATLESKKDDQNDKIKIAEKLDQLYLQLIDLYLTIEKPAEAESVIQLLESRLTMNSSEDDYAFGIMNEMANTLRKHNNLELSNEYYKKALLCIKRRYKTDFKKQLSTSKVLINIATVHYLLENAPEAIKYYNHSIEVLNLI